MTTKLFVVLIALALFSCVCCTSILRNPLPQDCSGSPGTYWDGSCCKACDQSCSACTGALSSDCQADSCNTNYYWDRTSCRRAPTVSTVTHLKTVSHGRSLADSTTEILAIDGAYFGGSSDHRTASVCGFLCSKVEWVSSQLLHCTVAGHGSNCDVVVTVNGVSSQTETTTGSSAARYDFPIPTSTGLSCVPPFGAADVLNSDRCNCWSGYASIDSLQTDCALAATCPGVVSSSKTTSNYAPARPITTFKDDKLYIKQTQPIVRNRRDTIIQFVSPNIPNRSPNTDPGVISTETCNYPGNVWTKQINQLDCLDEFYAELEWSQHGMCGFVEDVTTAAWSATQRHFKASLVTTSTESYKKDGQMMFVKRSTAYLMSVSFTKQVVALVSTAVSVYINDPTLDVEIVGDALYDVSSRKVIIQFETDFVWPYQINPALTLAGTWKQDPSNNDEGSLVASAQLEDPQPGQEVCDQTQDSDCTQAWVLTIDTEAAETPACNVKGAFVFSSSSLLCRDYDSVMPCAGNPSANFTIKVGDTDLCDGSQEADATAGLTYNLYSYYDSNYQTPQNGFQTGDAVYFEVVINDPTSSIDSILFNTITVSSTENTDTLYQLDPAVILAGAKFNITREIPAGNGIIMAGTDAVLSFHFTLYRNVLTSLVALTPEDLQTLTVTAVVDIYYHGNNYAKRSVIGARPEAAHAQFIYYNSNTENELPATEELNTADNVGETEEFSFSALESSASSNVATILLLGAVFVLNFF